MSQPLPIVLAITGASGVVYGRRLLEVLLQMNETVHLAISDSGRHVLQHELGIEINLNRFEVQQLLPDWPRDAIQPVYHHYKDFMTPIASGSFRTRAMVVCPCSGSTLSGIATAASANLIQRAADVHLKERRKLVLVPRETPLSLLQIENLRSVTLAGAIVLPASPGFYHACETVSDLVDFVVARILDQVGIENRLAKRWKED
jgi:4-hydroxy-3-polyprenylbenzoate decarboxylase